jgi:hypothetical protein
MFPLVSKELLEELNRRFPIRSPELDEQHSELMWRGGQRSVVDFLETIYAEQEASRLGE